MWYYASILYPGGSQADINSVGYDWVHNYWCDLTNEIAENGHVNPASNFAVTAMIILCVSLMIFFWLFADKLVANKIWRWTIKVFGVISMILSGLIFSKYHDVMIGLSSICALPVAIGIIREVYRSKMKLFKLSGLFCVVLLFLNNYIYYSRNLIEYLPLIQKLTFALVLIWIVSLNYKINKTS